MLKSFSFDAILIWWSLSYMIHYCFPVLYYLIASSVHTAATHGDIGPSMYIQCRYYAHLAALVALC